MQKFKNRFLFLQFHPVAITYLTDYRFYPLIKVGHRPQANQGWGQPDSQYAKILNFEHFVSTGSALTVTCRVSSSRLLRISDETGYLYLYVRNAEKSTKIQSSSWDIVEGNASEGKFLLQSIDSNSFQVMKFF